MTLIIRRWGLSYAPIKMKSWPNTRWAASAIKFLPPGTYPYIPDKEVLIRQVELLLRTTEEQELE